MAILDDFGQLAKERYTSILKDYNSKVQTLKSVSSVEDFTQTFMETAPELAEENAKIEQLNAALEQVLSARLIKATPLVTPAYEAAVSGSGVDITALDEQLKQLKATSRYLIGIYGEDALSDTEKIESRSKSGNAGTTGGRRIRGFSIYIDGKLSAVKNQKGEMKSTFANAAKELETETATLQRAFFDAAGSEDVRGESFPDVVDFQFSDHNIRVAKIDETEDE